MAVNVRFGSKADMEASPRDVRFTPKSGHQLSARGGPLCANSRPQKTEQNAKMGPVPKLVRKKFYKGDLLAIRYCVNRSRRSVQ